MFIAIVNFHIPIYSYQISQINSQTSPFSNFQIPIRSNFQRTTINYRNDVTVNINVSQIFQFYSNHRYIDQQIVKSTLLLRTMHNAQQFLLERRIEYVENHEIT